MVIAETRPPDVHHRRVGDSPPKGGAASTAPTSHHESKSVAPEEAWQAKLYNFQLELSEGRRVPKVGSNFAGGLVVGKQDMCVPILAAFAAVLSEFNESTGTNFWSVRQVQNHILALRDDGKHEEANEMELHLDVACLVKKRSVGKVAHGDGGSEVTRETTDGSASLSSRNFNSFFSSKIPIADRSDRLDLAWMRQCYDEDETYVEGGGRSLWTSAWSEATSTSDGVGGSMRSVPGPDIKHQNPRAVCTRRFIKDRRKQIRELARRTDWKQYDVYNAHVLLDYLENRMPPKPKRSVLDRLLGRKKTLLSMSSSTVGPSSASFITSPSLQRPQSMQRQATQHQAAA